MGRVGESGIHWERVDRTRKNKREYCILMGRWGVEERG